MDIPLNSENELNKLGDSFYLAKKRFLALERRFTLNCEFHKAYKNFINEYIDLGHAKYVEFDENDLKNYKDKQFLPHHGVFRDDSSSTPLRVVFDASMKTSSGFSVNDIMLKGFPVQPELFEILIRFRFFMF